MTLPVYNPRPTFDAGIAWIRHDYPTGADGNPTLSSAYYCPYPVDIGPICEPCWLKEGLVRAIGWHGCPHTPGGTT